MRGDKGQPCLDQVTIFYLLLRSFALPVFVVEISRCISLVMPGTFFVVNILLFSHFVVAIRTVSFQIP